MKEHKGYQEYNERRDQVLNNFLRIFNFMNELEPGSGDEKENEIADKYKVVSISELSLATLIKEYEEIHNK